MGDSRCILDAELRRHCGLWVAVRGQEVLASAADVAELVRWLGDHGESAEQIYRVPAQRSEVVGEHGIE